MSLGENPAFAQRVAHLQTGISLCSLMMSDLTVKREPGQPGNTDTTTPGQVQPVQAGDAVHHTGALFTDTGVDYTKITSVDTIDDIMGDERFQFDHELSRAQSHPLFERYVHHTRTVTMVDDDWVFGNDEGDPGEDLRDFITFVVTNNTDGGNTHVKAKARLCLELGAVTVSGVSCDC